MPVSYTKTSGQGHVYQVPDYPEAADAPKAFKDYSDFLDLILPPVGSIMPFVGNTAPTGWLLCDGAQYPSATYPKLSALCGTKFSTPPSDPAASAGNFRVPDLRGRVIAGLDSSQPEFDAVGKKGGAKTVTLTTSNMPAHTHTTPSHTHTASTSGLSAGSAGDHGHTITASTDSTGAHTHTTTPSMGTKDNTTTGGGANRLTTATDTFVTSYSTTSSGSHSHTVTASAADAGSHTHTVSGNVTIDTSGSGTSGSTGSGTAFDNTQPFVTMNHIIRAA